jgi:succinate dehydrogenase flavin-adding protein (antitoxin of CptAB toxin-antitoxin module)
VIFLLEREETNRVLHFTTQAYHYIQRRVIKKEVTAAGADYLTSLLTAGAEGADATLMASFAEYEDTKDPNELYDSVLRLSNRWRQERSQVETDLASLVDELHAVGSLDSGMFECLELLLFKQDPSLLAAHVLFLEAIGVIDNAEMTNEIKPHSQNEAWTEFWDSIVCLLKKHLNVDMSTHVTHLMSMIQLTEATEMLTQTDARYLCRLVGSAVKDPALQAAFYLYLEDNDGDEFQDSLVSLGKRWRSHTPHQQLLEALQRLPVTKLELDYLEGCVIDENTRLLAAWSLVEELGVDKFEDTVAMILDQEFATICVESKSDCLALLDFMKDQALLPTSDYLYLVDLAHADDAVLYALFPFFNVRHLKGPLDAAHLEILDTLRRLGSRWRRVGVSAESVALLGELFALQDAARLTPHEMDELEVMVYHNDQNLLATWMVLQETHDEADFMDTVHRILTLKEDKDMTKLSAVAAATLQPLLHHPAFTEAGCAHVWQLVEEENEVLLAAFAEYSDTGDSQELSDTVIRLANSWRRHIDPERADLLLILAEMQVDTEHSSSQFPRLPGDALEALERMVYNSDPFLLAAYSLYADSGFALAERIEFSDTVLLIASKLVLDVQANATTMTRSCCIDRLEELGVLEADRQYLKDLLVAPEEDLPLQAAFAAYTRTHDFEELADTLRRIASRWRQDESMGPVLQLLLSLASGGFLTGTEWEQLELMVYEGNEKIVAVASEWRSSSRNLTATEMFCEQLLAVLEEELDDLGVGYLREGARHVNDLVDGDLINTVDARCLQDLLAEGRDPTLLAIIEEAGENAKVEDDAELKDSLLRLSTRWRRHGERPEVLKYLDCLYPEFINMLEMDVLEQLVYEDDVTLFAALKLLQLETLGLDDVNIFVSTVRELLQREETLQMTACLKAAEAFVVELSVGHRLPLAGIEYLEDLLVDEDPLLLATFVQTVEGQETDDADLFDTIACLAARWKRLPFISVQNHDLLRLLSTLASDGHITTEVHEMLELLCYKENTTLIDAFSLLRQKSLQSQSPSSVSGEGEGRGFFYDEDWSGFWGTIVHLVNLDTGVKLETQISQLLACAETLFERRVLTSTEYGYLKQTIASKEIIALGATFAEFGATGDSGELNNSLTYVATAWRRHSPHALLLGHIMTLHSHAFVTFAERDYLECLVVQEDDSLLAAFARWEHQYEHDPEAADHTLWIHIQALLDAELLRIIKAHQDVALQQVKYLKDTHHNIPTSDYCYLVDLVLDNSNTVFAAVANWEDSSRADRQAELEDTLLRLASQWRRSSEEVRAFLAVLDYLVDTRLFLAHELEHLDLLVFQQDPILSSAFSAFYQATEEVQRLRLWYDLIDLLVHTVQKESVDSESESHLKQQILALIEEHAPDFPPADYEYLNALLHAGDGALLAIASNYTEADVSDEETRDTLVRLAGRWRREVLPSSQHLLVLVESLMQRGSMKEPCAQYLDYLILNEDPTLLCAYQVYAETKFSLMGWLEFWDTLRHVCKLYFTSVGEVPSPVLETQVVQLERCIDVLYYERSSRVLSSAGYHYLKNLQKRGEVTLEAAFFEYRDHGDLEAFRDTLMRLSVRDARAAHQKLLDFIDDLLSSGHITPSNWDSLQGSVFLGEPVLLGAWDAYDDTNPASFKDLIETVALLLGRERAQKFANDAGGLQTLLEEMLSDGTLSPEMFQQLFRMAEAAHPGLVAAYSIFAEEFDVEELEDSMRRLCRMQL